MLTERSNGPVPEDDRFTIDELARRSGMTVRNIRAHQSRGLLPPPEIRGRTGYYGPEHLARLELIAEMQADGFNLAAIKRLLERAREGAAEHVLGFRRALLAPFEEERPEFVHERELAERWGDPLDPSLLARAERLGMLRALGEGRYEIPSPTLYRAGEELLDLGVPPQSILDVGERIRRRVDGIARAFVELFFDVVWKPFEQSGEAEADWPRVREALERLRPLASDAVRASFQRAMTEAVERAFGQEMRARARGERDAVSGATGGG